MARKRKSSTASRLKQEASRLRDEQRAETRALRQRQKDALAREKHLQKIARVRLKSIHKAQRKRAHDQRKLFRHQAALLKRKGLIRPEIDIRKLQPSKKVRGLFSKFRKVLEGKETTYKVPPERIKELKEQGYTIVDGRIVLTKSLRSRGGKIYTAKPTAATSTRLETFSLNKNFDKQIKEAFDSLAPGEFIGFNVEGHNSYDLYQVAEPLIEKLNQYKTVGVKINNITIFRVKDTAAYTTQRAKERAATEQARNKRKRLRAKEKKAFRAGLRVTRGR
jgi:hypothetical protein